MNDAKHIASIPRFISAMAAGSPDAPVRGRVSIIPLRLRLFHSKASVRMRVIRMKHIRTLLIRILYQ